MLAIPRRRGGSRSSASLSSAVLLVAVLLSIQALAGAEPQAEEVSALHACGQSGGPSTGACRESPKGPEGGEDENALLLQLRQDADAKAAPMYVPRGNGDLGSKCWTDKCCAKHPHAICVQNRCVCEPGFHANKRGQCERAPVAWCTTGGGIRALAAAQGYANAFGRADLFKFEELASIAANSGGSWFLGNFAFDEKYHAQVLQPPNLFKAWLQKIWPEYTSAIPEVHFTDPGKAGPQGPLLMFMYGRSLQLGFKDTTNLFGSAFAFADYNYTWLSFIHELVPDIAAKRAVPSSRPVMQAPSLHFQITGVTSSFLDPFGGSPTGANKPGPVEVGWDLTQGKTPLFYEDNRQSAASPVQWVVPGTLQPLGKTASMKHPASEEVNYEVGFKGASTNYTLNPLELGESFEKIRPSQPPNSQLTVGEVLGMSSAASGQITSPVFTAQALQFFSGNDSAKLNSFYSTPVPGLGGLTIGDIFQGKLGLGLSNLAVCPGGECQYPGRAYVDGGWSDNSGAAQTLADLQVRYGCRRRLRMVLSDQNYQGWGKENLAQLFRRADVAAKPGDFVVNTQASGIVTPTPQIFEESFEDLTWTSINKNMTVQYCTLQATTVDNPSYGVKGGSIVDVLMFWVQADVDVLFSSAADYVDVALTAADPEISVQLSKWMERTS